MRCVILTGVCLFALVGTGRCESYCAYVIVSESGGLICYVAVATVAGIGGVACALAGGCGNCRLVLMTESLGCVICVAM